MRKLFKIFTLLLCSSLIAPGDLRAELRAELKAKEERAPDTFAAIGDSMTAGALAQFTTFSFYNPIDLINMAYKMLRTQFTNSVKPAERKDLSWATGYK